MREANITQEELFSVRTVEERIPKDHPLRKLRAHRRCAHDGRGLGGGIRQHRPGIDSTGTLAAGQLVASAVLGAFGAATGGADRVQFAVPVVCCMPIRLAQVVL